MNEINSVLFLASKRVKQNDKEHRGHFNAILFICFLFFLIISIIYMAIKVYNMEYLNNLLCKESKVLGTQRVEYNEKILFLPNCTALGFTNDSFPFDLIGQYEDVLMDDRKGIVRVVFHTFQSKDGLNLKKPAAFSMEIEYLYTLKSDGSINRLYFTHSSIQDNLSLHK